MLRGSGNPGSSDSGVCLMHWKPDVVLIDSRAGLDEVASACLTDLSASMILPLAIDKGA
uniref:Uncharacterized protein n=1 Tax=Candidatus Kentrum sp. TUN TaxID=2126343 RepID=A0A451A378_9GAMM|nr:MAG: hypothetical protein BECKTUN1418F_GA0071002_105615 [Candidatus Kentron sp. TUN]VFK55377.1 MAG: hypothetical protein BECKTUN1418D_GA0071000_103117 [Candidatus Kentron sp. TUN]VFK60452.1 MAG: hypothetical protein BECKTUN1418E_GA0071001_105814 [Candidatus Kentron sp. TUN]